MGRKGAKQDTSARRVTVGLPRTRHGMTCTPTYRSWAGMTNRCKSHPRYAGRGIRVCERWHFFENFLADMGLRPSLDHSLDRIDNNGNYEPGNCRWATRKEQSRNQRTNRLIEIDGVTKTLGEWAEIAGIDKRIFRGRIELGWDPKDAMAIPTSAYRARGKATGAAA